MARKYQQTTQPTRADWAAARAALARQQRHGNRRRADRIPDRPGMVRVARRAVVPDDEDQAAGLAECGCPTKDGVIRHLRSSCTDPVVARIDWYADDEAGTAANCEETPDARTYETPDA